MLKALLIVLKRLGKSQKLVAFVAVLRKKIVMRDTYGCAKKQR